MSHLDLHFNKSKHICHSTISIIFATLSALAVLLVFIALMAEEGTIAQIQPDFIQYWSAANLLKLNQNPYSFQDVHKFQSVISLGFADIYKPIMFWGPFPGLVILYPISLFDFSTIRDIWSLVGFIGIGVAVYLAIRLTSFNLTLSIIDRFFFITIFLLFISTFNPIYSGYIWGNISIFSPLIFSIYLFAGYKFTRYSFLSGFFLALLIFKPHIFYLLFIDFVYTNYKSKKWLHILCFLFSIFSLSLIAISINHQIGFFYFDAISNGPENIWRTASLTTYLKSFINIGIKNTNYLFILLGILFWVTYIRKNFYRNSSIRRDAYLILPSTLLFAPYIWDHDYCILIIPAFLLFYDIISKLCFKLALYFFLILFLLQGLSMAITSGSLDCGKWESNCPLGSGAEYFTWYYLSLYLIFFTAYKEIVCCQATLLVTFFKKFKLSL